MERALGHTVPTMRSSASQRLAALLLALAPAAACTEPGDSPFVHEAPDESGGDDTQGGAGDDPGDDTGGTSAVTCVDWDTEVLAVFEDYGCSASFCHGGDPGSGGLNVLSVAELLDGGNSGPAVVPGDPIASILLARVLDGSMPPSPTLAVDPTDAALLEAWIAEGALETPDPACAADDTGGVEPTSGLDFAADVAPVLEAHGCLQSFCHGASPGSAGLDLRTAESTVAGGDSGPAVVPCDPASSVLIQKLGADPPFKSQMPLGKPALPPEDVAVLEAWIAEGAGATYDPAACE